MATGDMNETLSTKPRVAGPPPATRQATSTLSAEERRYLRWGMFALMFGIVMSGMDPLTFIGKYVMPYFMHGNTCNAVENP